MVKLVNCTFKRKKEKEEKKGKNKPRDTLLQRWDPE